MCTTLLSGCVEHLLEGLDSAALNEIAVRLRDTPVDFAIQLARFRHSKVVLLAVELIKQWVQPSCDVPTPLQ